MPGSHNRKYPPNPAYQQVGKGLRYRRKQLGLTQQQVADMVGVNRQAVQKWEQGRHLPDTTCQQALAESIGFHVLITYDYAVIN